MRNPSHLGLAMLVMAAMAMPSVGQAQDRRQVDRAALAASEAVARQPPSDAAGSRHRAKAERASKTGRHPRKPTATPRSHARARKAAVPRSAFEERTANYFDPLSLALAPENRTDPAKSQYNRVTDSLAPPDQPLVSKTPDDAASTQISSASIEQMGKGNNHTVVVPLFQILNSLSQ